MDYIYIFKDVDEHGGRQRDVFGPSVDVASSDEVWFTHEDYLQRYAGTVADKLMDYIFARSVADCPTRTIPMLPMGSRVDDGLYIFTGLADDRAGFSLRHQLSMMKRRSTA